MDPRVSQIARDSQDESTSPILGKNVTFFPPCRSSPPNVATSTDTWTPGLSAQLALEGIPSVLGGATEPVAAESKRLPISPKVPLIDTTDLYHPPQDPGDNFDLIAAYALPEVDLRAVILDTTEKYRRPPEGPRDPGFIPVLQLNSIFGRNVPCGTTPYQPMQSPEDQMLDAPAFQQAGIELLIETLRRSSEG